MQPLTVVLGIVLGSTFSIAFSLAMVLVVFVLRRSEDARFAAEIPELLRAVAIFTAVTVVAAAAFAGSLRQAPWRGRALLLLGLGLLGAGGYYWPR
jgi:hypothetical protein